MSVSASPPLWKGLTLESAAVKWPKLLARVGPDRAAVGPLFWGRRRVMGAVFFPEYDTLRAKDAVNGLSVAFFDATALEIA